MCVADGRCTQEEANEALKTIFPMGITTQPEDTSSGTDSLVEQLTTGTKLIIPLVILGLLVGATKGFKK